MSGTRERIIELGEELIQNKGFNAFSYQDISRELGIKNAAVHYYFPSKENLGVSIVKNNIQRFEEMIANMQYRKFDEWHQLEAFMRIYAKSNREEKICLIGSLGTDLKTLSEPIQDELRKMTGMIVNWLTEILQSGRAKGVFAFDGESRSKALGIMSSMVAGLQLSRILDKTDFKTIHNSILDDLKPQQ